MDRALYNELLRDRLRSARKQAGLTQEQMATAIGLTRPSVANIERGHQVPGVYEVHLWARRCGVWIHELLPS